MRAAFLTATRQFAVRETPVPELAGDHDVLIKMRAVGVCGSDIHYFTDGRIGEQIIAFPFVIGHEGAGTVEEVGRGVTRVRVGDRIAIDPAVSCGQCDQCRAGRENTCSSLLFMGCPGQIDGCLRDYVVLPEKCCFPVAQAMSFDEATLSEPLAIALYAVESSLGATVANSAVAVLGAGPIGLSVLGVLQAKGVGRVYITDVVADRVAFASRRSPTWCGNASGADVVAEICKREPLLLDVVYECCGKPEALHQAIELLKPGGTLAVIGIPEVDEIAFPMHALRRKEITIKNIRRQNRSTQRAIELLQKKTVDLTALATHHFSLAQTQEAFDTVAHLRDGVVKAIITFDK